MQCSQTKQPRLNPTGSQDDVANACANALSRAKVEAYEMQLAGYDLSVGRIVHSSRAAEHRWFDSPHQSAIGRDRPRW